MIDKSSNKWILFPRPNPAAALRLFCFHYAGGSAQVFHGWPGRLPPSVEMGQINLSKSTAGSRPQTRRSSCQTPIAAHLMLPTIRADFELCETYEYHPEPPLECPMTIYGGLEDHEVEAERLAAWSEMTVGACEFRMFPGGHFYLNSSPEIFLQAFADNLLRLRLQD